MATGYGETIKEKLSYAHDLRFVLTESDYVRYSKMADDTMAPNDPESAGRYIQQMQRIPTGLLLITPLDSVTSADGQTVEKARLKITVTVPQSFSTTQDLSWTPARCPNPMD